VLRGGSWINNARNCRSAYRNRNHPEERNDNIGFRLVSLSFGLALPPRRLASAPGIPMFTDVGSVASEVLVLLLRCRADVPATEPTSQGRMGLVGILFRTCHAALSVSEGQFMAKELKVVVDFYDFTLWLLRHIEKFPRHHRYGLGRDMESRLQTILALLLRAKYSKSKVAYLTDANIELETLRFQLRLATDLAILPQKSHGYAAEQTVSIGSQIGGWLHSEAR
jgi:hypothetical protein